MKTLEEIFVREFKDSMRIVGSKDVHSIPLPKECASWEISGTEVYAVKGIECEYYSKLNKSIVRKLPKGTVAKRRVIDKATRGYKKDSQDNWVYEDYPVPSGSVVVTSDVCIELPYKLYLKSQEGYGYIDYFSKNNKTMYIYVLPKTVLYKVNQSALVLSVKSSMKDYAGQGYMTWDMGAVYLHVVSYNPNSEYTGSMVLKTKYNSINFLDEIGCIVNHWQEINFIPNIELCFLQSGENLCLKPVTICYDFYSPVELLPLSDKEIFGDEGSTKVNE